MSKIYLSTPPTFGFESDRVNANRSRDRLKGSRKIFSNVFKVLGYCPIVGSVVGVGRLTDAIISGAHEDARSRKSNLAGRVTRGVIETLSLGIIFLPVDLAITVYRRFILSDKPRTVDQAVALIKDREKTYSDIPDEFKREVSVGIAALRKGTPYKELSEDIKDIPGIIYHGIRNKTLSFEDVREKVLEYKQSSVSIKRWQANYIVIEALISKSVKFEDLDDIFTDDEEFLCEAFRAKVCSFKDVKETFRENGDFVKKNIFYDPLGLKDVSDELKNDYKIVESAICVNSEAFQSASESLQGDAKLQLLHGAVKHREEVKKRNRKDRIVHEARKFLKINLPR